MYGKIDWVNPVSTFGELTLSKTLDLIKTKVEQEVISSNNVYFGIANSKDETSNYQANYLNNIIKQQEDLCKKIQHSEFIQFLLDQLSSESNTKKDLSILILSYFSTCI